MGADLHIGDQAIIVGIEARDQAANANGRKADCVTSPVTWTHTGLPQAVETTPSATQANTSPLLNT